MRNLLTLVIIMMVTATTSLMTGCNNKPPFERLAEAVDSLNVVYRQLDSTDTQHVAYEKAENVVVFHETYPERIEPEVFTAKAENFKAHFMTDLVNRNESGIVTEIIEANANVRIDLAGLEGTKYEIEIANDEIAKAYEGRDTTATVGPRTKADASKWALDRKIAEAVDSVNAQPGSEMKMAYNMADNVLTLDWPYVGTIDPATFGPIAERVKIDALIQFFGEDRYDVASDALSAGTSVVINIQGQDGTKYQVEVPADDLAKSKKDLMPIQHELMEGNVTTL